MLHTEQAREADRATQVVGVLGADTRERVERVAVAAFMAARYGPLLRTATLLTGDGAERAEDLAQEALLRTYRAWHRIGRKEAAEAFTRTTMVRLLIKDRRRRWHAEVPTEHLPETARSGHEDRVATGVAVRALLRTIPAAQRAVLILRFYHQLTEREIAGVDARQPPRRKA